MPIDAGEVLRLGQYDHDRLSRFLQRYQIVLINSPAGEPIPGSYWGDEEAGLIGDRLYARDDTPLHSILHEASHFICLDPERRARLNRDAGSNDPEENAVCYLQILLADELPGIGRERMFRDMDHWGYSFRLGSTRAWFEEDASDALNWLTDHELVCNNRPSFSIRNS